MSDLAELRERIRTSDWKSSTVLALIDEYAASVRVTGDAGLDVERLAGCDKFCPKEGHYADCPNARVRVTGDAGLRAAAKALVDWYDGPPYVYVEGEMEERIYAIKEALAPKMCGSCGHPGHWRECKAEVTGLLETTYACPCRHRGPRSEAEVK